jgi:uncharacterized PurR-regulated membrane protein YhhQ (DUF165 family)
MNTKNYLNLPQLLTKIYFNILTKHFQMKLSLSILATIITIFVLSNFLPQGFLNLILMLCGSGTIIYSILFFIKNSRHNFGTKSIKN